MFVDLDRCIRLTLSDQPKLHISLCLHYSDFHCTAVLFFFQPEEKMKFDSIFDSLGPVGGMLSGEKVKPVLLNSKLPVDILGRV